MKRASLLAFVPALGLAIACRGGAPAESGSGSAGASASGSAGANASASGSTGASASSGSSSRTGSSASGSAQQVPVSPGCGGELATWLAGVMTEDDDMSERITPPLLDVTPSHAPGGARLELEDRIITLNGSIVGDLGEPKIGQGLHDALAALPPGTTLEIHADRAVTWATIALVAHEAQATGHAHVAFEVIAGHRIAMRPPPSSIDADLAAWDRTFDAQPLQQRLGNPPKSDFWQRVLRDCPGALDVVLTAGSGNDSPANVIAAKLPAATAACGCHVEIAAVERLLWRLYGREWAIPHAWVAVELGAGRAWVDRGAAPWGEAVSRLRAAAAGGPITLGAN